MLGIKLAVVLCLVLLANLLRAQELRIIHVGGLYAVTPEQVTEIYKRASYYFTQLNIKFRVKIIPIDYNPCIYKHSLGTRIDELNCFRSLTTTRRRSLTYWLTPPFITVDRPVSEGGTQTGWIGGIALLCGNVATGNAIEAQLLNGVRGGSRIDHSAAILSHEILHNLCATHYDFEPNLMHSAANQYTEQYQGKLPILKVTKHQIKRSFVKQSRNEKAT